MRTRSLLAVASLLVGALAGPAGADPADVPTLRNEATYFACASANKVQNVDQTTGTTPTWDTTAPTTSFTAGGGCGYYDNILSGGAGTFSATWAGTFTGNVDTIAVELHRLIAGAGGSVTAPQLVATLTIDGKEVFTGDVLTGPFTPSSTGASESATFTFTDIGLMPEKGDGTIERDFELVIDSYNEAQNAWVFDAAEVPSGLEFNPAEPEGTRVRT